MVVTALEDLVRHDGTLVRPEAMQTSAEKLAGHPVRDERGIAIGNVRNSAIRDGRLVIEIDLTEEGREHLARMGCRVR